MPESKKPNSGANSLSYNFLCVAQNRNQEEDLHDIDAKIKQIDSRLKQIETILHKKDLYDAAAQYSKAEQIVNEALAASFGRYSFGSSIENMPTKDYERDKIELEKERLLEQKRELLSAVQDHNTKNLMR